MSRTTRAPLAMEHALLGFLRRRPMHGYELYQQLCDPHGLWLIWRIKQSQLYALLAKLESEGLVSATLQTQETRPPRRVFRLTRAGRDRFLTWVRSPVPHGRDLRQDFLAKLYFAAREGAGAAAALVAVQQAECRAWLDERRTGSPADGAPFEALVKNFRLHQIEAMLAWLDTGTPALIAAAADS
ncbi:MAG: PadR family transcriptional regulator [Chloroflexi bacterium]|nr:PadR family transcriptional regulator [Chloroflexota bacterium]